MNIWAVIKSFFSSKGDKVLAGVGKSLVASLAGKNQGKTVVYREEPNSNNIICFVHGFNGSPKETFGEFPSIIKNDPVLNGWDMVSIGYASDMMPTFGFKIWAEQPNITQIAGYLQTNIKALLKKYNRIAFVAHSMGGLVVQRALLNLEGNDFNRITHVLLYGTPSAGLKKASLVKWYNKQIHDMDNEGKFIKDLREDWNARFKTGYPFSFITVAGELDVFVVEESSHNPFDEKYRARTSGNHVDMVKPDTNKHTSFAILKEAIVNRKVYLNFFSDEQLNNLQGGYAGVLNTLKGKVDVITKQALRDYIFALEGTKEIEDAIKVLEASKHVQENTDFMGILGGRYKRKYLSSYLQADIDKAIELYQQACTKSIDSKDGGQIYYHAINLAFLHLHNDDKTKMKEFAALALEHANKDKQEEYWKYATIAEAELYLGNFEVAKTNYQKAIALASNRWRDISSMYMNAIHGSGKLNNQVWQGEIENIFRPNQAINE